jgi:hypothetical protein
LGVGPLLHLRDVSFAVGLKLTAMLHLTSLDACMMTPAYMSS